MCSLLSLILQAGVASGIDEVGEASDEPEEVQAVGEQEEPEVIQAAEVERFRCPLGRLRLP